MMLHRTTPVLLGIFCTLSLSGCGLLGQKIADHGSPEIGKANSATLSGTVEVVAAAIALNYVYQPFEPNWDVADVAIAEDTHRVSLRMKRFVTGGEGEAWSIAKRYAERLTVAKGASGYAFLDFTQGIDSATPIARRVAEGTIRFFNVPAAPAVQNKAAAAPGDPKS